jgi:hypothetical protein
MDKDANGVRAHGDPSGQWGNSVSGRLPVAARCSGRLRRVAVGTRTWVLSAIMMDARGDGKLSRWARPI